ncbi:hypothetical protein D3C71_1644450 [compost metagenome]
MSKATASTPPSRELRVSLVSSPILLKRLETSTSKAAGVRSIRFGRASSPERASPCSMKRLSTMSNSTIGLTACNSSGRLDTWAPRLRRQATLSTFSSRRPKNSVFGARTDTTGTRTSRPLAGSCVSTMPLKVASASVPA